MVLDLKHYYRIMDRHEQESNEGELAAYPWPDRPAFTGSKWQRYNKLKTQIIQMVVS